MTLYRQNCAVGGRTLKTIFGTVSKKMLRKSYGDYKKTLTELLYFLYQQYKLQIMWDVSRVADGRTS